MTAGKLEDIGGAPLAVIGTTLARSLTMPSISAASLRSAKRTSSR